MKYKYIIALGLILVSPSALAYEVNSNQSLDQIQAWDAKYEAERRIERARNSGDNEQYERAKDALIPIEQNFWRTIHPETQQIRVY